METTEQQRPDRRCYEVGSDGHEEQEAAAVGGLGRAGEEETHARGRLAAPSALAFLFGRLFVESDALQLRDFKQRQLRIRYYRPVPGVYHVTQRLR